MDGSPSDAELVRGCLEGRKDSWDAFVGRFSDLVYWSIWKTLERLHAGHMRERVPDIFQGLFRKLLENEELARLRQVKNVRRYLVVAAARTAMDEIRSARRRESWFAPLPVEVGSGTTGFVQPCDVSGQAAERERAAIISRELDRLPPREKVCVEWHFLNGVPHREIAAVLGMPEGTVSTVIRRAREKLKQRFLRAGIL